MVHYKEASKAVFLIEIKLVKLQSQHGDVKFVGGGIEDNESQIDCMIREVKEELGYEVIEESIKKIGIVILLDQKSHRGSRQNGSISLL